MTPVGDVLLTAGTRCRECLFETQGTDLVGIAASGGEHDPSKALANWNAGAY